MMLALGYQSKREIGRCGTGSAPTTTWSTQPTPGWATGAAGHDRPEEKGLLGASQIEKPAVR
jgi:hypothetical protein